MNALDLTTLDNVKQWLGLSGLAIASITNASPAVATLQTRPATPLLSGATYAIAGAQGMALPAGNYAITVIDPVTFSIPVDSTSLGAYAGGAYIGISDPFLANLITRCSAFVQSWLNRTIPARTYSENRNGTGTRAMSFANYPILAVNSLTIGGITVPARPAFGTNTTSIGFYGTGGSGYSFNDSGIYLDGYCFTSGYQNVAVNYLAGFAVQNEAQTIPANPGPYTLTTLARWSAGDLGVKYASNGVALTAVVGTPSAGQYAVSGSVYTFAAADAGKGVLISYAMVPFDVEQATIDTIGDWFKYVDRIGKISTGIEQQQTTFTNTAIPVRALSAIQQYKRVTPVGP